LAAKELKRKLPVIPKQLLPLLELYRFPGNIREMESLVFDAISRSPVKTLSIDVFHAYIPDSDRQINALPKTHSNPFFGGGDLEGNFPSLKKMNDILIQRALEQANGNQSLAAKLLGISRQALNKRLKCTTSG
jgi:transcriptional regulator with PAS, ATPase and Fis domain